MKSKEFVNKLQLAAKSKTIYIKGCFGAPMNERNKMRYTSNNSYNRSRAIIINNVDDNTFGFDCVCLIKGILWGWNADKNKNYGGAKYINNNIPDINIDIMINSCSDVSTDFSKILPGELLYKPGHVGAYIGDGLAIESTPAWNNGVQITAVDNIGKKHGYNYRSWLKHGKLPWIDYSDADNTQTYQIIIGDYHDYKKAEDALHKIMLLGINGKIVSV